MLKGQGTLAAQVQGYKDLDDERTHKVAGIEEEARRLRVVY